MATENYTRRLTAVILNLVQPEVETFDSPTRKPYTIEPNMKWIGWPIAEILSFDRDFPKCEVGRSVVGLQYIHCSHVLLFHAGSSKWCSLSLNAWTVLLVLGKRELMQCVPFRIFFNSFKSMSDNTEQCHRMSLTNRYLYIQCTPPQTHIAIVSLIKSKHEILHPLSLIS